MTAPARAFFGFPRTGRYFTPSGGNWLATYPVTNLQVLPLSNIARSFDATTGSTVIVMNAAAPITVGVVALIGHNLSQSAQIRIVCWSDIGATAVAFDSGTVNVWPASYSFEDLTGARWNWYARVGTVGSAGIAVGAMQIWITDTGNTAGYVQAGYLEIAETFDTSFTFAPGSQYGFDWRSVVTEAIGGAEYVDRRDKPRVFRGTFPNSRRSESLGQFYEMQRQLDYDQPVLFVPVPDETTHLLRTVMFARQTDPGLASMRVASNLGILDSVPLALKEIIG